MLPFIIIERTQGVISRLETLEWIQKFEDEQIFNEMTFSNQSVIINQPFTLTFNYLQVSNVETLNPSVIQFVLNETYVSLVLAGTTYQTISYETLMMNVGKTFEDLQVNPQNIVLPLIAFVNQHIIVQSIYYVSLGLSIAIEYLALTFIFTFIFGIYQKQMHPFGKRFKVGLYLSTIYVASQVLLMLFQLYIIGALSFLLTYIMYYRAYKTKRIIHE
jgi:hypothetical protein